MKTSGVFDVLCTDLTFLLFSHYIKRRPCTCCIICLYLFLVMYEFRLDHDTMRKQICKMFVGDSIALILYDIGYPTCYYRTLYHA